MARLVGGLRRRAIRVKEATIWYEEDYDAVGAFEEYEPEYEPDFPDESEEAFSDLELDSEMEGDADERDLDDED